MSAALQDKASYHHGDLRNALILAAAELIEESGSIEFAMVEAARRAGVSSAAPYRHFRDREELLKSVSHLCFMGLTETAREAVAETEIGSEEAIVALGRNYIRFMLKHRNFHDLMWGDMGARAMEDERMDLRGSGFYVLADAVAAVCERESIAPVNPVELATELWAMVHGLGTLAMNQQVDRFLPGADPYELLERSTRLFFDGLRMSAARNDGSGAS